MASPAVALARPISVFPHSVWFAPNLAFRTSRALALTSRTLEIVLRFVFPVLLLSLLVAACGSDDLSNPPATSVTDASPTPAEVSSATPVSGLLGAYSETLHTIRDPAFEALPGANAHFGALDNAAFRIEIPDGWDGGDLVLWAHGFRGFETEVYADSPTRALRQALLEEGVAWAASSYSENGYVPGIGADDTLALKRYFEAEFGEARNVYLVGASMGGNVVSLALENHPGEYNGALSLCGALGGQTQIDFLVSWARLAEAISGLEFPVGPGATASHLTSFLLVEATPLFGEPAAPTELGLQYLSAIRMLTGGPRPFFLEGFAEQYVANFAFLLVDPTLESLLVRAATNESVVYDIEPGLGLTAEQLNGRVVRQQADPAARDSTTYPDKVPTTGNITAPLLTLHTTGDLFVPISQAQEYQRAVDAAGKSDLLVQRAIRAPGHCTFSEAEIETAFRDLVAWVETGARPAGEDLTGDLSDAGREFTNPLRPGDPGTP